MKPSSQCPTNSLKLGHPALALRASSDTETPTAPAVTEARVQHSDTMVAYWTRSAHVRDADGQGTPVGPKYETKTAGVRKAEPARSDSGGRSNGQPFASVRFLGWPAKSSDLSGGSWHRRPEDATRYPRRAFTARRRIARSAPAQIGARVV